MPGVAYYNEIDGYCCDWLSNLMDRGLISPGFIDNRSIADVRPDDLLGFDRVHFFAGIGVWDYALNRAGWTASGIWTGSCPCQPFSAAGQQKGFNDERHLWPVWFDLIRQCRPATVLGEQVASALDWLDLVSTDLEGAGYAFGASDLCAAGFGGAHIRQRLYFVAHTDNAGSQGRDRMPERADQRAAGAGGVDGGLDHPTGARCVGSVGKPEGNSRNEARLRVSGEGCADGGLAEADRDGHNERIAGDAGSKEGAWCEHGNVDDRRGASGGLGNARHEPSERHAGSVSGTETQVDGARITEHGSMPVGPANAGNSLGKPAGHAPLLGRNPADWLFCRDGKWRPVEPGIFKVAYEVAAGMGCLRPDANIQAERLIYEASERFAASREEILRALRGGASTEGLCERSDGRPWLASEAQILLDSLFKHHGEVWDEPNSEDGSSTGDCASQRLRVLWRECEARNPSYQRGLAGQPGRKLTDAMRSLSSAMARAAQEAGHPVQISNAFASFPLSGGGADTSKNRVGRLRAYGNALDAETATQFVAAVREAIGMDVLA